MLYKKTSKCLILACSFLAISACDNLQYKSRIQEAVDNKGPICFKLDFDPKVRLKDKKAYQQREARYNEVIDLFSDLGLLVRQENGVKVTDFGKQYYNSSSGFCFNRYITVHDITDVQKAAKGEINLIYYTSSLDYIPDWATDPRISFYYGTPIFFNKRLYKDSISPRMAGFLRGSGNGIYIKDYQLKVYYNEE